MITAGRISPTISLSVFVVYFTCGGGGQAGTICLYYLILITFQVQFGWWRAVGIIGCTACYN